MLTAVTSTLILIGGALLFLYASVGLLGMRVQRREVAPRAARPPRPPRDRRPPAPPRAPDRREPADPGDPYEPPDSLWLRHPRG